MKKQACTCENEIINNYLNRRESFLGQETHASCFVLNYKQLFDYFISLYNIFLFVTEHTFVLQDGVAAAPGLLIRGG
jgi:hypothetical protein